MNVPLPAHSRPITLRFDIRSRFREMDPALAFFHGATRFERVRRRIKKHPVSFFFAESNAVFADGENP